MESSAAGRDVPTFVVIGAAGDGKSSLVKALTTAEYKPECGKAGGGVTKHITEYPIRGFHGEDWSLLDTFGVGDHDKGVAQLSMGLKSVFQTGRQIDGVIVTTLLASNRLGLAPKLVHEIIQHGLVKNSAGISPWERVIVVGTQRDRCDEEEIAEFPDTAKLFFEDTDWEPKPCQIVTSTTKGKGEDGMSNLLESMAVLGRAATVWDPNFESNGGFARMSAGLAKATGGNEELIQLEMEMEHAWNELVKDKLVGDGCDAGAQATGQTGAAITSQAAQDVIAASVGAEAIQQYSANQVAAGVGSGMIKGSGIAIKEGSEVAVGKAFMEAAQGCGTAVFKSRAGNVVVEVGTRMSVANGVSAGTSLGAGAAGIAAEFVAGRFEATEGHKKKIGFGAQVGTATAIGACTGPVGALVGASVGALSWAGGQVVGHIVEQAFVAARGENNPKVLAWRAAKQRYEDAKKDAKHKN